MVFTPILRRFALAVALLQPLILLLSGEGEQGQGPPPRPNHDSGAVVGPGGDGCGAREARGAYCPTAGIGRSPKAALTTSRPLPSRASPLTHVRTVVGTGTRTRAAAPSEGRDGADGRGQSTGIARPGRHHPQQRRRRTAAARSLQGAVLLNFEGLANLEEVGSYYDGGGGGAYGARFGPGAAGLVDADAGGTGDFADEPSPSTVLIFGSGTGGYMTVGRGFTSLTFMYSAVGSSALELYDGPDATGTVLYAETLQEFGGCLHCGDPNGVNGWWPEFFWQQAAAGEIARSVRIYPDGLFPATPYIDNVQFVQAPTNAPTSSPTNAPTNAPTNSPTNAPTNPPTNSPTNAPTSQPTKPPTSAPTSAPTRAPSMPPTRLPTPAPTGCVGTSVWVYDAAAGAPPLRRLANDAVTCLEHPYSVEVRPCVGSEVPPPDLAVTLRLVREEAGDEDGRRGAGAVVVHARVEKAAPYFLFGDSPRTGDVRPSPGPLPDGRYRLTSSVGGAVAFVQSCACPKGKKAKKGCMKKRRR